MATTKPFANLLIPYLKTKTSPPVKNFVGIINDKSNGIFNKILYNINYTLHTYRYYKKMEPLNLFKLTLRQLSIMPISKDIELDIKIRVNAIAKLEEDFNLKSKPMVARYIHKIVMDELMQDSTVDVDGLIDAMLLFITETETDIDMAFQYKLALATAKYQNDSNKIKEIYELFITDNKHKISLVEFNQAIIEESKTIYIDPITAHLYYLANTVLDVPLYNEIITPIKGIERRKFLKNKIIEGKQGEEILTPEEKVEYAELKYKIYPYQYRLKQQSLLSNYIEEITKTITYIETEPTDDDNLKTLLVSLVTTYKDFLIDMVSILDTSIYTSRSTIDSDKEDMVTTRANTIILYLGRNTGIIDKFCSLVRAFIDIKSHNYPELFDKLRLTELEVNCKDTVYKLGTPKDKIVINPDGTPQLGSNIGGSTLQKTNLRVQIKGQTRVVYLNKYKTQYVKYNNEYMPLSKAKKLEKNKH